MSLILEALRKSEAERQRDGTPNVAMELPPVPTRGNGATPGWVWPTLLVVVIGAVLVAWLGIRAGNRDNAANHAAAATTPEPLPAPAPLTPAPTPQGAVLSAPTPTPSVPAPAPIPPTPTTLETTSTPSSSPMLATDTRLPAPPVAAPPPPRPALAAPASPAAPAPPPVRPAAAPAAVDATEDAPPITSTGLPAVKLSMHMWDADPAKRFVIIDGQRMGEGDRSGGLAVIAIRRDGVIVERNGLRAKVPLP